MNTALIHHKAVQCSSYIIFREVLLMKETMRGLNQGNIQNLNRSLLLNLLRREKICARTTLAEHSGLKQATVTHIINDFMNWNLVKEVG